MRVIHRITRRSFIKESLAVGAVWSVVPRHVLGGAGQAAPSSTIGGALVGVGNRGPETYRELVSGFNSVGISVQKMAECDVKWKDRADNKTIYTDFRRVIERNDIDVVAIATPPHWHALISIAAMEAGKDVVCEKPMTRFIAEGRAVVDAAKRYGRMFQIGTYGRFDASKDAKKILTRNIMKSGLLNPCPAVVIRRGGLKVKMWSGLVNAKPQPIPANLDWDLYCGPSPLRPYHSHRTRSTHRGYWDYEGGGLGDMAQHELDPETWVWGLDDTAPVEATPNAPPAHHDVVGMWGWVELKYANGLTLVLDSAEWGDPWDKSKRRGVSLEDLSETDREKIKATPDPEPLRTFAEAVVQRKPPGGHAEAAHRTATIFHLANIAIRVGRKIRFDPVKEVVIGDDAANRLAYQPMRAPWHL